MAKAGTSSSASKRASVASAKRNGAAATIDAAQGDAPELLPAKRSTAAVRFTRDELRMFARVRRASLILDGLQRESLEELDLSFVEYSALRVIDISGPPHQLSPSHMAELLVRTTGGMTKIVDRLERRGFVKRVRDSSDRRSVLVVLTEEGKAMSRKANSAYRVARKQVLAQLDRDDVAAINAHLDLLLEAFERAGIDAPGPIPWDRS